MTLQKNKTKKSRTGLTMLELVVVLAVIAIVAFLAVPMRSRAAEVRLRSAASLIASDLEYIKNLAINNQRHYSIIFDNEDDSFTYKVCNSEGIIDHPLRSDLPFKVDFVENSRLRKIVSMAAFDASEAITFDYLGSPFSGVGTENPLQEGKIILQTGDLRMTIYVEPVTGYVNIRQYNIGEDDGS
jgi:prepilin-type N-terminal cleavage/methylation domain-containing protein